MNTVNRYMEELDDRFVVEQYGFLRYDKSEDRISQAVGSMCERLDKRRGL